MKNIILKPQSIKIAKINNLLPGQARGNKYPLLSPRTTGCMPPTRRNWHQAIRSVIITPG
jgi:hypothetical protein